LGANDTRGLKGGGENVLKYRNGQMTRNEEERDSKDRVKEKEGIKRGEQKLNPTES